MTGPAGAAETLDGLGVATKVIGNSVDGVFGDVSFFEYYAFDGTVHGVGDDGPYDGTWTIENDKMCIGFDDIVDCYTISLDGDHIDWINDGGEVEGTGLLLPGDPRKLEMGGGETVPDDSGNAAPGGGEAPLAMPDVEPAPDDDQVAE
jgi:hypothetical protein